MEFEAIVTRLKERWPKVEALKGEVGDPFCLLPADQSLEILRFLKEDPECAFDSLMSLQGADNGMTLWVVYPLHSMRLLHRFMVKVALPRENPELDSVVPLWGMADFFEREAYDLYGIRFKGHPDLRRILNPPDWEGWPGRKDYEYPPEYQGIPTVRQDQFFADAVQKRVEDLEQKEKVLIEQVTLEVKKELAEKAKAKPA